CALPILWGVRAGVTFVDGGRGLCPVGLFSIGFVPGVLCFLGGRSVLLPRGVRAVVAVLRRAGDGGFPGAGVGGKIPGMSRLGGVLGRIVPGVADLLGKAFHIGGVPVPGRDLGRALFGGGVPEAGFRLGPRGFRRTIGAVARKAPIPGVGSGRILLGSGGGVEIPTTARFLRRFTARRLRDGGRTVRRQVSDPVLHVLGVVRLRQVGDSWPGVLRLVAVLERALFRGGPGVEGGFLGSVGGGFEVVGPVLVEVTEERGGLGGFPWGVGRAERVVPRTQERRPFGA